MSVDGKNLASTLQKISFTDEEKTTVGKSCFYWTQCLKDIAQVPPLNLPGIGIIPFPITEQDICKVKTAAANIGSGNTHDPISKENQPHLQNTRIANIDVESSSFLEKVFRCLAVHFVNNIVGYKMKDEAEVQIMLNQLIICTPGQCLFPPQSFSSDKPSGAFGKLFLQVPVQSGYIGGILEITTENTNSFHALNYQSDQYFYCTAFVFSSTTKYEWHPVEQGCMVVLDFDLVFRPTSFLVTHNGISGFFVAAQVYQQIIESFSAWNYRYQRPEELKEEFLSSKTVNNLFIIPLNEAYHENHFSFSTLRGNDLQLAFLFLSIQFLDVHLAVIRQRLKEKSSIKNSKIWMVKSPCSLPCDRSFEILHWIHFNSSLPQKQNYQLKIPEQLVGDIKTILLPGETWDKQEYRHPAIVIQPRQQSIRRCCIFDFEALLDYLDSGLKTGSVDNTCCLDSLSRILQFCQEHPSVVWNVEASKAERRILRLFNICKTLQAQEESLVLIDLLNNGYEKSTSTTVFYGGIGSQLIAKAIVDTLQNNGGWDVFSMSVLRLITSSRLISQLKNFATVVLSLLENRCIEGAYSVVHSIFSMMCSNLELVRKMNPSYILTYFDAIVALKAHPDSTLLKEASILDKLVLPIFREMRPYQQYRLIINLQKMIRFKKYSELYRKLTHFVFRIGFKTEGMSSEFIQELVTCYIQPNDNYLSGKFISNILWRSNSRELYVGILKKTSSSTAVKNALFYGVFKQSVAMEKLAIHQTKSTEKDEEISKNLLYFFVILVQVEHTLQLDEKNSILARFTQLYDQMPVNRLIKLITSLIKYIHKFDYPCGQKLLIVMGHSLINLNNSTFETEPQIECLLELLKYFSTLQNQSETLVHFLLDICEKCRWGPYGKTALVRSILSLDEILPNLARPQVRGSVMKLLFNFWITSLCQVKNIPCDEEKEQYLYDNINACMENYISKEKINTETPIGNEIFAPLLDKISIQQLGFIMWEIYQSDINGPPPSLKMLQSTLGLYRCLCQRFIIYDLKSLLQSNSQMIVEGFECLLWLGDTELISSLTDKILDSNHVPNLSVKRIVKSKSIRQLADGYPCVSSALCLFLEKYLGIVQKSMENEAKLSWRMPNVLLPEQPGIQKFFHSPAQRMSCINFRNQDEAVNFSKRLPSIIGPLQCYAIEIIGSDSYSRCDIIKVKSEPSPQEKLLLIEKHKLEAFINILKSNETSKDLTSMIDNEKIHDNIKSILPHSNQSQ